MVPAVWERYKIVMKFIPVLINTIIIVSAMSLSGCTISKPLPMQSSQKGGMAEVKLRMVSTLPPPINTNNGLDQPIAANDILQISIYQVKDLDRDVQVDASGKISLPLIGPVVAVGKTVQSLQQEITAKYQKSYLQAPQVSVFMRESYGQRATVEGEASRTGIYPVTGRSTLLEIIAQAGGLKDIADPAKIYIFRNFETTRLVANFSITDIRSGKMNDPRIYGGDLIVIFSSSTRVALKNLKDVVGVAAGVSRIAVTH